MGTLITPGMIRHEAAFVLSSRHRRDWAVRTVREAVLASNPKAVLAVWGLAYKENTHSVKNSPSLATIAQLPDAALRLHDPLVPASAAAHPGADALMILTPWPEYRAVDPLQIAQVMRGRLVLDPYAVLEPRAAGAARLQIHTLGRAPTKDRS